MQLDELGSRKVVALEPLTLTRRSRLYSLRPIGIGIPEVESLTGYIARLAKAHCVTVGTLLSKEFAGTFQCDLPGLFRLAQCTESSAQAGSQRRGASGCSQSARSREGTNRERSRFPIDHTWIHARTDST
jgi:hypothetical protein